eukprot:4720507-Lingulodinium_polyedra.AAC.1
MERASVRFASRCGGGRSFQPHLCITFNNRYTMMRSSRPSAATTACKPHASRKPCEHHVVFAWRARGVRFAGRC